MVKDFVLNKTTHYTMAFPQNGIWALLGTIGAIRTSVYADKKNITEYIA